jgi:hypothetical protein
MEEKYWAVVFRAGRFGLIEKIIQLFIEQIHLV